MSTITQIGTEIATILGTLDDIESTELDSYLPTVRTSKVALVIPPLGLSGVVDARIGTLSRITDRIPCKLWIKLNNRDLAIVMQRARDICLECAATLQLTATAHTALNGLVEFFGEDREGRNAFVWSVDEAINQIGNDDFILATLFVTVTEWRNVQP